VDYIIPLVGERSHGDVAVAAIVFINRASMKTLLGEPAVAPGAV
jgi:hypothetical protein